GEEALGARVVRALRGRGLDGECEQARDEHARYDRSLPVPGWHLLLRMKDGRELRAGPREGQSIGSGQVPPPSPMALLFTISLRDNGSFGTRPAPRCSFTSPNLLRSCMRCPSAKSSAKRSCSRSENTLSDVPGLA